MADYLYRTICGGNKVYSGSTIQANEKLRVLHQPEAAGRLLQVLTASSAGLHPSPNKPTNLQYDIIKRLANFDK